MTKSQESLLKTSQLTAITLTKSVDKIKKAFPTLPVGFYDVFCDRLKHYQFTDDRLLKSVNYVIDNCLYPTPTIANFIIADKEISEKEKLGIMEEDMRKIRKTMLYGR